MKAVRNFTEPSAISITTFMGGAIAWTGTKEQLQLAGFGAGMAYPGEPGAPVQAMTVRHAGGFRAQLRKNGKGKFTAAKVFDRPTKALKTARLDAAFQRVLSGIVKPCLPFSIN